MNDQLIEHISTNLEEQITRLDKLSADLRELFQKSNATVPTHILDELNQLSTNLGQLKRKFALSESRNDDLLGLLKIGQVVNSTLELNDVLRIVMDTIIHLLKAERGFLMLRNKKGELVVHVARNWEQESILPTEFAISRTIINKVVSQGIPILTTNAQEDPRFENQESIVAFNLRAILCIPLKVKDRLIGVIYADNRIQTGIFTENERELLFAFANQAAIAIENAHLFESLRKTLSEVIELKNLMDNIFSSIASGVITIDSEGTITMCNQAAQAILDLPHTELVGRSLEQAFQSMGSELTWQAIKIGQSGRPVVGLEFEPVLPTRGLTTISFNLSPLKDSNQKTKGVAIVLNDITQKKHLEAQQRLFERMVSPAVIEQLDPDQVQLGGTRVEITTLFVDIRGFTGLSEHLSPEKLVAVLNRYLAIAADAILAHEGTIDKFLGDAVMAWFNAPVIQPDHILRAIRTALSIRDSTRSLQKQMPPEYQLSFGAGIHSGEAVLGLVGTEKRLEYTAIGDSVNTAKRIQENASAEQILISADTYTRIAKQIKARPAGAIQAKGKKQPILVYEVLGLK